MSSENKQETGSAFLEFVLQKLEKRVEEVNLFLKEGQKEIQGMHEYYWENYTEMDQYGYEDYDNQQALFQQVNANQQQLLLKQRFTKMMDSPFFGRVDFVYEGDEEPETFYIGIGNFSERTGQTPLIYDWRAPVSGLFYDYDKGPAQYEAPVGELTGEITSKWQYKIRGGNMVYEFESDVKIDDEILAAELGSSGEVQLKNIIRTIQKEQNAIIRNTKDRILVIQGAAGSGKTSVALHRIAYLLYHDRKNLKSSDILILSPNSVFSDYISHILPELGEENIREMSFDLFAYKELQDVAADCEDRYDQIEKNLKFPFLADSLKEKETAEFTDKIEGFLLELEDSLMNFRDVEHRGFVKTEEEILQSFIENNPDYEQEIRQTFQEMGKTISLYSYTKDWIKYFKKRGYKLYILSNFSKPLYDRCQKELKFLELMDGGYMSWQIHCLKPEPEIFQKLITDFHIDPSRAVFLDDMIDNVAEARAQGLNAIHFTGKKQALKQLLEFGVK